MIDIVGDKLEKIEGHLEAGLPIKVFLKKSVYGGSKVKDYIIYDPSDYSGSLEDHLQYFHEDVSFKASSGWSVYDLEFLDE